MNIKYDAPVTDIDLHQFQFEAYIHCDFKHPLTAKDGIRTAYTRLHLNTPLDLPPNHAIFMYERSTPILVYDLTLSTLFVITAETKLQRSHINAFIAEYNPKTIHHCYPRPDGVYTRHRDQEFFDPLTRKEELALIRSEFKPFLTRYALVRPH